MTAVPQTNASPTPSASATRGDAPASPYAIERDVMTATNIAVPAAPASCCTVPIDAEPCEYWCGSSDESADVNSGVNMNARPRLSVTCSARTNHGDESAWIVVKAARATATTLTPGMTSGRGPTRS